MHLKISASKLSIILLERLKDYLNTNSLVTYNQSGCVKTCYEIIMQLEKQKKKIDWDGINKTIANLTFTDEEQKYSKRVTTLSISEDLGEFICTTLPAELKNIYSSRIYPATALNFILAAGYISIVLNQSIEI